MFEHFWTNLLGGFIGVAVIFVGHLIRQFFRDAASARDVREARTEADLTDDVYAEFSHDYTLDISVPHWMWLLGQRAGYSGTHSTYLQDEYVDEDADQED